MTVTYKRTLVRLAGSRLLLGIGVGSLLIGLLNWRRDPGLAVALSVAGVVCLGGAALGHKAVQRDVEEEP